VRVHVRVHEHVDVNADVHVHVNVSVDVNVLVDALVHAHEAALSPHGPLTFCLNRMWDVLLRRNVDSRYLVARERR
jgi:hypothetical protein